MLLDTIIKNRSDKNSRDNSCFYFPYQESMSLEAAEELEKRETIQKEASEDRKLIKLGVYAAFFTAFATLISGGHWIFALLIIILLIIGLYLLQSSSFPNLSAF